MNNNIIFKVMIIDDSALMRNLISRALNDYNDIEVVGTALNGNFGLKKLNKLQPDIIILDLEMPEMNGIEFLKERDKLGIKTPVIILSAHAKKGAKITLEALSLGASEFVLKPTGTNIDETKHILHDMIKALAKPDSFSPVDIKNKIPDLYKSKTISYEMPEIHIKDFLQPITDVPEIEILSIGISTGGPNALRKILPLLPVDFKVPIVIVQHMPPGFTYEFAKNLDNICKLSVKEAEDNDIVKPGRIFIAPGDRHVTFEKKKLANVIKLIDTEPVNGHKPSADVLFKSTAQVYGRNSIACIMTGMGKDGAENIGLIKENGGITIAQDQSSCVVFGMPKVAIQYKNIHTVIPLDNIIDAILNIVNNKKMPDS